MSNNSKSKQQFCLKDTSHKFINECYQIISKNMEQLGVEIQEEDKTIFCNNMIEQIEEGKTKCYTLHYAEKIVAFAMIYINDEDFYISEIQISEDFKKTKALIFILNELSKIEEYQKFKTAKFNIRKNNDMSNKTFIHLGAKRTAEREKAFSYQIDIQSVKTYLQKFSKFF